MEEQRHLFTRDWITNSDFIDTSTVDSDTQLGGSIVFS
jgi:hypothetical protein